MPFFRGTPGRFEQVQKFTEAQQSGIDQALQQALSGLQQPLGAGFAPIAQQARTQFEEQTVPSLAERFTAMGGQRSSAFPQALGQAGAGLEQGLAAQQAQFGLQERGLLQQLLGTGLTPEFDTIRFKPQPGFLESGIAQPLFQGLGQALPGLATGGAGAISSLLPMLLKLLGGAGTTQQQAQGAAPQQQYQPYVSPSYQNLQLLFGGGF